MKPEILKSLPVNVRLRGNVKQHYCTKQLGRNTNSWIFKAITWPQMDTAAHYQGWYETARQTGYYIWPHLLWVTYWSLRKRKDCNALSFPLLLSLCPSLPPTLPQRGARMTKHCNLISEQKQRMALKKTNINLWDKTVYTSVLPVSILSSLSSSHQLVSCARSMPQHHVRPDLLNLFPPSLAPNTTHFPHLFNLCSCALLQRAQLQYRENLMNDWPQLIDLTEALLPYLIWMPA